MKLKIQTDFFVNAGKNEAEKEKQEMIKKNQEMYKA